MIRTIDLSVRVDHRLLIGGLDWEIQAGQCWAIIGRNGAGKSTLLRVLAGLRPPDAGVVQLRQRALPAWPLADLARVRAYLAQSQTDAFGYQVIELVLAARHPYQHTHYWDSNADLDAAHAALQALDVAALATRDVRTLSGGERQRVAIAAALAQETPILLLDEPTNALDLAHQVSVMDLLARQCQQSGKAVVMVSHDLNLLPGVASHALLLMNDGPWQAGPIETVMQAPILSRCLGHPIETIQHASRTLYIPAPK